MRLGVGDADADLGDGVWRVYEAHREDDVGVVWIGDEIVAVPTLHGGVELTVSAFWASAVGVGKRGDVAELVGDECFFPVEQRGWDGAWTELTPTSAELFFGVLSRMI